MVYDSESVAANFLFTSAPKPPLVWKFRPCQSQGVVVVTCSHLPRSFCSRRWGAWESERTAFLKKPCLFILGLILKGCKHSVGRGSQRRQHFDWLFFFCSSLCDYSPTQTRCTQLGLIPRTLGEQTRLLWGVRRARLWLQLVVSPRRCCCLAPGASSPACLEEREVHSSERATSFA